MRTHVEQKYIKTDRREKSMKSLGTVLRLRFVLWPQQNITLLCISPVFVLGMSLNRPTGEQTCGSYCVNMHSDIHRTVKPFENSKREAKITTYKSSLPDTGEMRGVRMRNSLSVGNK